MDWELKNMFLPSKRRNANARATTQNETKTRLIQQTSEEQQRLKESEVEEEEDRADLSDEFQQVGDTQVAVAPCYHRFSFLPPSAMIIAASFYTALH